MQIKALSQFATREIASMAKRPIPAGRSHIHKQALRAFFIATLTRNFVDSTYSSSLDSSRLTVQNCNSVSWSSRRWLNSDSVRGGGQDPPSTKSVRDEVDHVVLLQIKESATKQEIQELYDRLYDMVGTVPGVLSVKVGPAFVTHWMEDRRRGYTHALRVRLTNRKALRAYQENAIHKQVVAECIKPLVSAPPLAVDYDTVELILNDKD